MQVSVGARGDNRQTGVCNNLLIKLNHVIFYKCISCVNTWLIAVWTRSLPFRRLLDSNARLKSFSSFRLN